jgi:hypothetical protein
MSVYILLWGTMVGLGFTESYSPGKRSPFPFPLADPPDHGDPRSQGGERILESRRSASLAPLSKQLTPVPNVTFHP